MATKTDPKPQPDPAAGSEEPRPNVAAEYEVTLSHLVDFTRARLLGGLRQHDLRAAEGAAAGTAELAARLRRGSALASVSEQGRVPAVATTPDRAILHGRVTAGDGTGLEDVDVVVLDDRGREAARACTAAIGYFKFVFPPGKRGVAPNKEDAQTEARQDAVEVRLQALDASGKKIAGPSEPITLARGKVIYCELAAK